MRTADDVARLKLGAALLGRDVRFAHQPEGPLHHVNAVGSDGMVRLADMAGDFAPHLFVIASESETAS